VKVETSDTQKHRELTEILRLIEDAQLPPRISDRASRIFQRLGKAEALVHGSPIEKVHFHEVGAVDAIVDIVGTAAGFEQLGVQDFFCSPLNVGAGRVDTAHGNLPVPAPATAELLRGAPTYSNGIQHELVTPTGAAIVATVVTRFGPQPRMTVSAIGLGAGSAQLTEQPNMLRMFIGESAEREVGAVEAGASLDEEIVTLEANLDDMNPQVYGYFVERALEARTNEKKSAGAASHRTVQACGSRKTFRTCVSRNDDAGYQACDCEAAHAGPRNHYCEYDLRSNQFEDRSLEWTHPYRYTGI
jgi:uncharacterized protein (TIGR00299 family) protein